jgi:hypothetical protein
MGTPILLSISFKVSNLCEDLVDVDVDSRDLKDHIDHLIENVHVN